MSITAAPPPPSPGGRLPSDAVGAVLVQLRGLLDTVVEAPVWSLDDRRLQARLGQALGVRAGVDELVARLVAQVDDRDLAATTGSSSTRAHLMATHRVSAGAAAAMLTQARATTERTESTRTAWATGHVSAEQAVVIAAAVDKIGPDVPGPAVQAAQLDLVGHALDLSHTQLQVAANHLVEVVDPDGADHRLAEQLQAEEERARHATCFRGRKGLDGIACYSGRMPNLQYDILTTALHAIAAPRRTTPKEHDRDGKTGGGGDSDRETGGGGDGDPTGRQGAQRGPEGATAVPTSQPTGSAGGAAAGLVGPFATADTDPAQLTYRQRMGHAMCELLEHLPVDALPHHGVTNATIVVTIDHHRLTTGLGEATLSTGDTISAAQTRRLACNAGLLPLVLGADSAVLDLGYTRRCYDRHQRIALAARDRGCIFPGCERPPAWCEAHHIKGWSHNGPTNLDNGCLLCSYHHHLIHQGHWTVAMAPDGTPEVIPPPHIDPHQQPLRHQRFKTRREQGRPRGSEARS